MVRYVSCVTGKALPAKEGNFGSELPQLLQLSQLHDPSTSCVVIACLVCATCERLGRHVIGGGHVGSVSDVGMSVQERSHDIRFHCLFLPQTLAKRQQEE